MDPATFSLEPEENEKAKEAEVIFAGGDLEILEDGTYRQLLKARCNIGSDMVLHGTWTRDRDDFVLTNEWGRVTKVRMTRGGLGFPVFETLPEPSAFARGFLD